VYLYIITCTFAFGLWPSILNPAAILQSCVFVALRNTFGKDKFDIVKLVGKKNKCFVRKPIRSLHRHRK
jgi:hypothetical protein